MSTNTETRAWAERLADEFFTLHQQQGKTPIPGSRVSFVEGVLAGQRDAQQATDTRLDAIEKRLKVTPRQVNFVPIGA